ncbi:MAG: HAD family hydrolase [Clostridia bacterium]|nr:HAD family hydrolase [Clostridia bacterium]
MKPIRMVIFDKDGTLMDFDAFWVTVSRLAVPEMLAELKVDPALAETLYEAMGIRDGITDVRGVLCWGTYEQMGEEMHRALTDAGVVCDREEVVRLTKLLYHRHAPEGEIRPACENIRGVLGEHIRQGRQLALVTTDGPGVTRQCLLSMDIGHYFSAVCTDDGVLAPKPDPMCIELICEQFGYTKDELVMVGDTMNDIRFARNGGIRVIAVAGNAESRACLAEAADAVVPDISHAAAVMAQWEAAE